MFLGAGRGRRPKPGQAAAAGQKLNIFKGQENCSLFSLSFKMYANIGLFLIKTNN